MAFKLIEILFILCLYLRSSSIQLNWQETTFSCKPYHTSSFRKLCISIRHIPFLQFHLSFLNTSKLPIFKTLFWTQNIRTGDENVDATDSLIFCGRVDVTNLHISKILRYTSISAEALHLQEVRSAEITKRPKSSFFMFGVLVLFFFI